MTQRDIIVIAASAGGVEALMAIASSLPRDMRASIFVVLHQPPSGKSMLPDIAERVGSLPATTRAMESHPTRPHLCRSSDLHMLLEHGVDSPVARSPENRHRPSADPLFRSAAPSIGIELSGCPDWLAR